MSTSYRRRPLERSCRRASSLRLTCCAASRTAVDATWMALLIGVLVATIVTRRSHSVAERRVRSGLDGFFMLPLGVSAVTLGFGFLITLDRPPLDLRDSPLLVPMAYKMRGEKVQSDHQGFVQRLANMVQADLDAGKLDLKAGESIAG